MKNYYYDAAFLWGLNIKNYCNQTMEIGKNFRNYSYNVLTLFLGIDSHKDEDFSFPHGENIQNNDLTYHFLSYGKEGERPIVFLHGILLNSAIWHNFATYFSKENSVYSIDFLGHGCSTKKKDLNLEDLVEEVRYFVDEKKLKDPIIIGHSLGGLVASSFAAMYPEKVNKLIILSSVDYSGFTKNIFNIITSYSLNFFHKGCLNYFTIPLITSMLENIVFNKVPSTTKYEDIYFTMFHLKIRGMREALLSLMQNYEIKNFTSKKYKNIKSPTLIIHGDSDRLINCYNGKTLQNNIPGSKLHIITRGSHMLILENKEEVKSIIEEFIN